MKLVNHSTMFENVDVEIWRTAFRSKKYLIGSIYRPPPPTVLIYHRICFINDFSEYLCDICDWKPIPKSVHFRGHKHQSSQDK